MTIGTDAGEYRGKDDGPLLLLHVVESLGRMLTTNEPRIRKELDAQVDHAIIIVVAVM